MTASERLHKFLATAGVASRRACEALIADGRVSVDGRRVTTMGLLVDPESQVIEVNGRPVGSRRARPLLHLVMNKPSGVVSTASDPNGRTTVLDLARGAGVYRRIFPVGRLDLESEGLLLLTDDGDLTYRLTHPRFGVEKEYVAGLSRPPTPNEIARLGQGVELDGAMTAPALLERVYTRTGSPAVRVTLHEGRHRQVRRMFACVGIEVVWLLRERIGSISLGTLPLGGIRPLRSAELRELRRVVGLESR